MKTMTRIMNAVALAVILPATSPAGVWDDCVLWYNGGAVDANGDGKVRIGDASAILRFIVGDVPENFNEKAADVNGDGFITVVDVTTLVDYILGVSNDYFVFENADVNGDGSITVTDVTALVDIILGIENDSNN